MNGCKRPFKLTWLEYTQVLHQPPSSEWYDSGTWLFPICGFSNSVTLQELKLQGIKIRDGVIFSRYSWYQWFRINLSDFGKLNKHLYSTGPGFESFQGHHLIGCLITVVLIPGHQHLLGDILNGFKYFTILAVTNFNEYFCPVGHTKDSFVIRNDYYNVGKNHK